MLLSAFNLILALAMQQREADRIMTENIKAALEQDQRMLVLYNAENELWRTAELSGKHGLDWTESLKAWRDAFPNVQLRLSGTCGQDEPSPQQLSVRIRPLPESNKTTTAWAPLCINERLILSSANATRTIYLGGDSGFGEERDWTYTD